MSAGDPADTRPTVKAFHRCPSCHTPLALAAADPECPACGLKLPRIDGIPLLVDDFEAIQDAIESAKSGGRAAWYEDSHAVQRTGPYRHHFAKRRQYLDQLFGRVGITPARAEVAVDIGCGDGANLGWLDEHVGTLYASDYNITRLIRASRVATPNRLFLADATNYPVVDDTFDLVFMNHVLEHIPDDRRALEEIHRILKPGGIAIIGVPNEGAAWWRLAYRLEPQTRESTDHVHFYTATSVAGRCRHAGFDVREVAAMGWGPPHWTLDARVRGRKWVDDLFEAVGRRIVPGQASSLYVTLGKPA